MKNVKKLLVKILATLCIAAMLMGALPTILPGQASVYAATYIGKKKAQKIALKNAKFKKSQVSDYSCWLDVDDDDDDDDYDDDDDTKYEVRFRKGNYRYEYEINAYTGKIVSKEYKAIKVKKSANKKISRNKAKSIALKKAGVSNPKSLRIKSGYYKGSKVWKVEFRKGAKEWEYKISRRSGTVLQMDYDLDYDYD